MSTFSQYIRVERLPSTRGIICFCMFLCISVDNLPKSVIIRCSSRLGIIITISVWKFGFITRNKTTRHYRSIFRVISVPLKTIRRDDSWDKLRLLCFFFYTNRPDQWTTGTNYNYPRENGLARIIVFSRKAESANWFEKNVRVPLLPYRHFKSFVVNYTT